ncbi:MAG: electron transport complex subunit RsxC [Marinobacter sp.]|uniref:electron transport complex subunit RsxC n=1 Tax=Marinobacter sp. TaxID=50741 RepID=UPI00299F0299|nr:electron transport complex subunit RsxC [Marinobacter sp.]MDX1635334.1 electron transport complex subunit RsxC [Marinobacter sp.]
MTQIWDFPGGIHPAENKHQSTARGLLTSSLPERLVLPLQQHIGSPAQTRVQPGDQVNKGDCLAEALGTLGVPVHAPTSGRIEAITKEPVPHPSGLLDWCISLIPDGEDHWGERKPMPDYHQRDRQDVLAHIRDCGIVGLGGAGFPTSVKLKPPSRDKVDTLILNGAECEPYITADDTLMRYRAAEVISGMEIMAWVLEPERCLIGIEDNKPEAIAALREAVGDTRIEVVVIPTKYPSGGEKQLIQILTGLEVPHGGIPADIGVMCQNVGTAVAVSRAIHQGEPLISRVTTITGEAVAEPANYEVLLGTPVSDLLAQAGLDDDRLERLVLGGPMMGYTLQTDQVPVVKTTNCVIAAARGELPQPPPEQPCIRCGACSDACPMELLPQQLFWHAKAEEFDKAEHLNLFDCIECGVCSYVCPSSIPLVQYYRFAKGEIRTQRVEQIKSDQARQRFEARQARLEREQAEKEAKRKQRARAAAEAQASKAEAGEESGGSERDAKAAAVQAALARKGQKPPKATSVQPQDSKSDADKPAPAPRETAGPDLASLEKQLDQARDKLATMETMLAEARAASADNVDKLERAVAKNQDRVKRAREALDAARAESDGAPHATPQND